MKDACDFLHVVTNDDIPARRKAFGRAIVWASAALLIGVAAAQTFERSGTQDLGFENWRPTLYAYVLWAGCLCWAQVLVRGEQGKRVLFVLPAVLFLVSLAVFPLIFGLIIAFSDWNLSSPTGRKFNGLDNLRQMWADPFYWNALLNMIWYMLVITVEYAIAFGLALLINSQIQARKFFRMAFLILLMLSPVAVSWMIGKSMPEPHFDLVARLARFFGAENLAFLESSEMARFVIIALDAWTYIPFMMIMFLVGLQAIPKMAQEASKVDGTSSLKLEGASGLAQAKKADFVTRHGRLYCERCLCDPDKTYGKFGSACIEVHYAAEAMSEMDVPDQTRLEDLKCLCANCHRIVHAEFRSAQQQTK